jgi:hypothetical protein
MLQIEVLVVEILGTIDGDRPCAITVDKVTTLAHEVGNLKRENINNSLDT